MLRAIKGFGSSFGVVVDASFHTVDVRRRFYSAVMSYPRTSLSSVANDIARLHQTLPAASRISTRIEVSGGRTEIVLHLVHHRDRSEANAVFAPLILEASRVEAAIVPYAEAGSQFANAKDHEAGHRWASTGIHLAGPWINSDGLVAMSNNFIKDAGESTRAGLAYAVLGLDVENTDQIKSIVC